MEEIKKNIESDLAWFKCFLQGFGNEILMNRFNLLYNKIQRFITGEISDVCEIIKFNK